MNISEQIDKINDILDDYETVNSIVSPKVSHNLEHIENFINMSYKQLQALGAEECAEGAYLLSQYAFFVQREQNKQIAINNWAQSKLNECLSGEIMNMDSFIKYEVKIAEIVKTNNVAAKLMKITVHATSVVDRLNFLSSNIKHMSDMLLNLHRAKKYKNAGEYNDQRQ
jgi:hypothetical protein